MGLQEVQRLPVSAGYWAVGVTGDARGTAAHAEVGYRFAPWGSLYGRAEARGPGEYQATVGVGGTW